MNPQKQFNLVRLKISKTLQRKIRRGYPWVFHYQVKDFNDLELPGNLGVIYDNEDRFLAIGLYDPDSDIVLRVLQTGSPVDLDLSFFRSRFEEALKLRDSVNRKNTTGYRVISGENDRFPGLVLDRYGDTAVIKIYSSSWQSFLPWVVSLAHELLPVQRSVLRLARNLSAKCVLKDQRILRGSSLETPVEFLENGFHFQADVLKGQKTGFYFDQRENREKIQKLSNLKRVLNVFSYTGGFSIYSIAGGCKSILEIDSNSIALKNSQKNIKLNFPKLMTKPNFFKQKCGDAFQILYELIQQGCLFDLVVLDPPAFAKRKNQKRDALRSYARLAELGSRLTENEGLLFTASCSMPIEKKEFFESVRQGIMTSGKAGEKIFETGHPTDHPVIFPEGSYLKGIYWKLSNYK